MTETPSTPISTPTTWQARKRETPREDPTRTEYQKLLADDWFRYHGGPGFTELSDRTDATQGVCREINATYPTDPQRARELMSEMLGACGPNFDFRPPVYMDYAERLHIGADVFINADLLVLGGGLVTIGDRVLIGPGARFYTPNHPLDLELRQAGWEIGLPITIEDDAWLGGSVVVCPGVRIGRGAVVGAGSVVTRDVPDGAVVAGNPARVIGTAS